MTGFAGIQHWRVSADNVFAPKPGVTDLMRAASAGDVSGMERELAAGAKVNAQDSSGFTALMFATRALPPRASNRGVLEVLLKAGADPNIRSNRGQTAIMAAIGGPAGSERRSSY
jgi:ankyrin repeat protein